MRGAIYVSMGGQTEKKRGCTINSASSFCSITLFFHYLLINE